jgi:hypothetical protein
VISKVGTLYAGSYCMHKSLCAKSDNLGDVYFVISSPCIGTFSMIILSVCNCLFIEN